MTSAWFRRMCRAQHLMMCQDFPRTRDLPKLLPPQYLKLKSGTTIRFSLQSRYAQLLSQSGKVMFEILLPDEDES